jgi:spermidine synthase
LPKIHLLETLNRKQIRFLSFIEGMLVMTFELCGAKMSGPVFGNSISIWCITLAVTMFSLSAGYYSGGLLLKKGNVSPKLLINLFWAVCVWLVILPSAGTLVYYRCLELSYTTGALISQMILLTPPLFLLGVISPLLVEQYRVALKAVIGKSSGSVWSVSTLGGIAAAVLIGFILLPYAGIRYSCLTMALFPVFFLYIYNKEKKSEKGNYGLIALLAIGILVNISSVKKADKTGRYKQIFKSDGLLGQLSVVEDRKYSGRKLYVNGISQSFMNLPTGRSLWKYIHRIAMYSSVKPAGSKVLLAGMGAGNMVEELLKLGFEVDVVDIDSRMQEVAAKYFNLKEKQIHCSTDDARHYIKVTQEKYDIIIYDLSSGESQPSNLYTTEGFNDTKQILKDSGMLFVHSPGMLKNNKKGLESIGRTLLSVDFKVNMLNTSKDINQTGEFVFYATFNGPDLRGQDYSRQDAFGKPYNFPQNKDVYANVVDFNNGIIMTDDRPLLEYLQQKNIKDLREESNRDTKEMIRNKEKQIF